MFVKKEMALWLGQEVVGRREAWQKISGRNSLESGESLALLELGEGGYT